MLPLTVITERIALTHGRETAEEFERQHVGVVSMPMGLAFANLLRMHQPRKEAVVTKELELGVEPFHFTVDPSKNKFRNEQD